MSQHSTPEASGGGSSGFSIDRRAEDEYVTLILKGPFETYQCPKLQQEIDELLDRGVQHVLLDLRRVRFINSTALGAVISAHKRCRAEGGELVLDQPSEFVWNAIHKLGIDQVVPTFAEDDAAVRHIVKCLNDRELTGASAVGDESVIVTLPDETRIQQFGGRRVLIGSIGNVDGTGLRFTWSGRRYGISVEQAEQLLFTGGEIELKFQVKLVKRGYFHATATVGTVEDLGDDHVRVTTRFTKIKDVERDALAQFATDMAYLKTQLQR